MTTRSRVLTTRLAAAGLLMAALGGCADGDELGSGPTSPASGPTESTASPSDLPSETAPTTPEVEPATGPRVRTERFTVRAPEGWKVTAGGLPFVQLSRDPGTKVMLRDPHGLISVTILPSGRSFTLDEAAKRSDAEGRRLDDIDLDGEPAYHFLAPGDIDSSETFGLWREPFETVSIDFGLFGSTQQKRSDLAASMLATWEWTS